MLGLLAWCGLAAVPPALAGPDRVLLVLYSNNRLVPGNVAVDRGLRAELPSGSDRAVLLFDVGIDLRTGVNDKDYKAPFPFNGTIDKLTVVLGPPQLTAMDQKRSAEAVAKAGD